MNDQSNEDHIRSMFIMAQDEIFAQVMDEDSRSCIRTYGLGIR